MSAPAVKPFTIHEIKEEILWRARQRQASIERGEYDVPLHFVPLPLHRVVDQITPLDERYDFLHLAVPPANRSLLGRIKRVFKSLLCTGLRWLLIRQVEFNLLAVEQARASAEVLGEADRNLSELVATVQALQLQMHALRQRLARLENEPRNEEFSEEPRADNASLLGMEPCEAASAYLDYFKGRAPIRVIGCDRGDFLRLLISEGLSAQGVEPEAARAEYCRERELPVVCADPVDFLRRLKAESVGGIFLSSSLLYLDRPTLGFILGHCWSAIAKNGLVIAEFANGVSRRGLAPPELTAELVSFLLESQSFTVVDHIFSAPIHSALPAVTHARQGRPFDRNQYRLCAVVGRK
jgi:hypothetical protein